MKITKEHDAYIEKNCGKNILPLSIFDNVVRPGGSPIDILFFVTKKLPITEFKRTLIKTVEHYNIFSSCLIMIGQDRFALQYCTDGFIPMVLPDMDVALSDQVIEDFKKRMIHIKTLPGEPLFAVTGVQLKDGILAGVSVSHAVSDGISILLFLYAWLSITGGKSFLPPSPQKLFKGSPLRFDQIDKAFIPPLSELSEKIQNRIKSRDVKVYLKREYFSEEFLSEIKNKAKSENEKYIISNNQIMNAFLLKKYHHHILPHADKIVVRTPITLRDLHPDIDSLYLGTAIFLSFTEFTKDEINNMSIPQIAYRMKESITKARNKDYIKEIAYLSEYGIEFKPDVFKNYPPYNTDTDIISANLVHLNDLDTMNVGSDLGTILSVEAAMQTGFTLLKEKSGSIFAEISSMYPLI